MAQETSCVIHEQAQTAESDNFRPGNEGRGLDGFFFFFFFAYIAEK